MKCLSEWLEDIEGRHPTAIDLGLERVKAVAQRLGIGQWETPTVIVGGTNGKGSTVAMLESLARVTGLRVATYTSPHLFRFNERIRFDGLEAEDGELCRALELIEAARLSEPEISLTYFEMTTLLALHLCQERQAELDLIVLEVGLGGRLDAVNIVDGDVAVITSIGLDHQAFLGDTLTAIAQEKVAIGRKGKPLILAEADMPAMLGPAAEEIGALKWQAGSEYQVVESKNTWSIGASGMTFQEIPFPKIKLSNAAAATLAFSMLYPHLLTEDKIAKSCETLVVNGRFTTLAAWPQVLFDVAHNPAACAHLASQLECLNRSDRIFALCSFLADKDIAEAIKPLRKVVNEWHCAPLTNERAMAGSIMSEAIGDGVILHASLTLGIKAVLEVMKSDDILIVFGSFYTVSEVQQILLGNNE